MPDRKDYIIDLLRQQRDEAINRLVSLLADANVKIEELTQKVKEQVPSE